MSHQYPRREFLKKAVAGTGAVSLAASSLPLLTDLSAQEAPAVRPDDFIKLVDEDRAHYRGPNVIIIRFGGGVRRRETIVPAHTYCPYFLHELTKRGTFYRNMEISQLEGVETGHGQGTLHILTGKYDRFKDAKGEVLKERFEAKVPTVFEYFRKAFNVPQHQTLIVNGEDRINEEFYSFSNHHLFGFKFRSNVLSLYRFKIFLLRRQIERGGLGEDVLKENKKLLAEMESQDYRTKDPSQQAPQIHKFWEEWSQHYGDSGFVNPRGDRLLTELTIRAIKQIRPKLIMVNYNDPDYVHWGNKSHYTRGISIIDEGLQRIVSTVEADDAYRDNTVFVIVPDCGRDSNRAMAVPFQHHSGTKSSHEIFGLLFGPGVKRGKVIDDLVDQTSIAATIGKLVGFKAEFTEGPVLAEAIA